MNLLRLIGWMFLLCSFSSPAQSPRQVVLDAMKEHPDDPWPRGQGHVVLATPGTPEEFKAYLEPGASFSPAFPSFGVSIWIGDADGKRIATSDSIPLEKIEQHFVWPKDDKSPAVRITTEFYEATWSSGGTGIWKLNLKPKVPSDWRFMVMIRSVGPAGGELKSLLWDFQSREPMLLINRRWSLSFQSRLRSFDIVDRDETRLTSANFKGIDWRGEESWGYARFNFAPNGPYENHEYDLRIQDNQPVPESPFKVSRVASELCLNLPGKPFVESLNAQAAHLLMGLVGNETRPGDPNNYPLNWLRDGAYEIVALARCGQLNVAKKLCGPFAANDFFGGFGSEADGPGLALWALEEVAGLSADREFDAMAWPHVTRKVALIEEMLAATNAIRKPYAGPIIPKHRDGADLDLVCEAAMDGLINGRMDWQRSVLFVNAAAYRGLVCAVSMAQRTGHLDEAKNWGEKAGQLRAAWNRAFKSGKFQNERNYICALHPMYVVEDPKDFLKSFEPYFNGTHGDSGNLSGTPLWTYFNVAQAHQWLVLGQADTVWRELDWFWEHQASPGLFTWWEGSGEENNFGRWAEMARGWVRPPHVTPHYWTAAEMLLLQLDMLARVDETMAPTLVIGAGIPKAWLDKPMDVAGIGTRFGKVDWKWREGKLSVNQHGRKLPVKLGAAFPENTELR